MLSIEAVASVRPDVHVAESIGRIRAKGFSESHPAPRTVALSCLGVGGKTLRTLQALGFVEADGAGAFDALSHHAEEVLRFAGFSSRQQVLEAINSGRLMSPRLQRVAHKIRGYTPRVHEEVFRWVGIEPVPGPERARGAERETSRSKRSALCVRLVGALDEMVRTLTEPFSIDRDEKVARLIAAVKTDVLTAVAGGKRR